MAAGHGTLAAGLKRLTGCCNSTSWAHGCNTLWAWRSTLVIKLPACEILSGQPQNTSSKTNPCSAEHGRAGQGETKCLHYPLIKINVQAQRHTQKRINTCPSLVVLAHVCPQRVSAVRCKLVWLVSDTPPAPHTRAASWRSRVTTARTVSYCTTGGFSPSTVTVIREAG